jgi:hypothetical protein
MFCEGVQHHLRFCFNHLSCVKVAAFQFYLQSGKQKSGVDGDNNHVVVGQKFPQQFLGLQMEGQPPCYEPVILASRILWINDLGNGLWI